jgi:hypothetical protein
MLNLNILRYNSLLYQTHWNKGLRKQPITIITFVTVGTTPALVKPYSLPKQLYLVTFHNVFRLAYDWTWYRFFKPVKARETLSLLCYYKQNLFTWIKNKILAERDEDNDVANGDNYVNNPVQFFINLRAYWTPTRPVVKWAWKKEGNKHIQTIIIIQYVY